MSVKDTNMRMCVSVWERDVIGGAWMSSDCICCFWVFSLPFFLPFLKD